MSGSSNNNQKKTEALEKLEKINPALLGLPGIQKIITSMAPEIVCVALRNGLGNRIFQVLAGLAYAEKHKKSLCICRQFIHPGFRPHEQNLDGFLLRIFPDLKYIDTFSNYTTIQEKQYFKYDTLPKVPGNVLLTGYFQCPLYFPSRALVPVIRTASYPNTFFVHVRGGDYLEHPGEWGFDVVSYYKKCFDKLKSRQNVKYLVFSNDNQYADKMMKQFNVPYTISDKADPVDSLIEMANCEGGICVNSTFGWLGGFFQGTKMGQIFMPSIWNNTRDCKGVYPSWATIIKAEPQTPMALQPPEVPQVPQTLSLVNWQTRLKDPYNLIVQASSTCGGDLWMPFPIGMSWVYVKFFNNSPSWQIGPHDKLLLCAINRGTDSRRRSTGINRMQILNTLQKNSIHNTQLQGESYFSSLPSYKFVISPEGNGIDCHRHYEALLAGCIPIMEYNDKIVEKYKGLPILYTTDYSEITSEYLNKKYKEMSENTYDFSRLFLSYYSNEQQEEIRKCGNFWIQKTCGPNIEWYKQNIVWVTIINNGYVDFTKNFIESMKRNDCVFPLVVYCTDNESMNALKGYTGITCINAMPFLKFKMTQSLSTWQTIDYKRLVFAKLDAIKYALSQYKNSYIGYIDMDIVMLKNPEITIMNTFKSNPNAVFVSQCDEPKLQCSNTQNCQHFCSGVIVFKNLSVVNKLLDYNENDVMALTGDQHYLLNMANKYNIKHITIEKNIFLNGKYPGVNDNIPLNVPPSAELVHYNYLVGDRKFIFMKKNNMWYI